MNLVLSNGSAPPAVADTRDACAARDHPAETLRHYDRLAQRLWLPPPLAAFADRVLADVAAGKPTWASVSGPYGCGKTSAGVALWRHAAEQGFLAVPPLSCRSFDDFAAGVAALAAEQLPGHAAAVRRLLRAAQDEELDRVARTEAARHELPAHRLRSILDDQLRNGRWAPDRQGHRLVEFLAGLGRLAAREGRGLVVVIDELQQMLGPLDADSLRRLREFVWGLRTEQAPCGLVLTLDARLEARLGRWAEDLLHRVRDHGPALRLDSAYSRDFPPWLWDRLTGAGDGPPPPALAPEVLAALGQLVERPDLSNGPRTVVDVFGRAAGYFVRTGRPYDLAALADDLEAGRFRFFGEGAPVQRTLLTLLGDPWLRSDPARVTLVRTLAFFPAGCPADVLGGLPGGEREVARVRAELFGPLLVELPDGPALEALQPVRRPASSVDRTLQECWESLPALSALAEASPALVERKLLPRLFRGLDAPAGAWRGCPGGEEDLSGWRRLRGTLDEAFPSREVAVRASLAVPQDWPPDVDLCVAFVCDAALDAAPAAELRHDVTPPRLLFRLPVAAPSQEAPAELERYHKYLQPEPFRPVFVLAALQVLDEGQPADDREGGARHAFRDACLDYLLRVLLRGESTGVRLSGPELFRALFTEACRRRYPDYRTLRSGKTWAAQLDAYRRALACDRLTAAQRCGQAPVKLPKDEAYRELFGQASTAAGDSLVRSLGPLLETAAKPAWALWLRRHPGEDAAAAYLRGLGRRGAPRAAVAEGLRHKGYLPEESDVLVDLLAARGLVSQSADGRVRWLSDADTERALLQRHAGERHAALLRLGVAVPPAPADEAPPGEWQRHLDALGAALRERFGALAAAAGARVERLYGLIGRVRALALPVRWAETPLSTHLAGISTVAGRTLERLLRGLRKEAAAAEAADLAARQPTLDVAVDRLRRDAGEERVLAKLEARTADLEARAAELAAWSACNDRLAAAARLCRCVAAEEPGPQAALDRLLADFRHRFATATAGPLRASDEFLARLAPVRAEVQSLLFSLNRAHDGLRSELVRVLQGLAAAEPPAFRAEDAAAAFGELTRWGLEQVRRAYGRCLERRAAGAAWRDTRAKRTSWKRLAADLEARLAAAEAAADADAIAPLAKAVRRLGAGFVAAGPAAYDAGNPPDFAELERRLRAGEIRLTVTPADGTEGGPT